MRRLTVEFLVATTALLVLALSMGASSGVGKTYRCMVINDRTNTTYQWTYYPLRDAIAAAAAGDTLWVRGECFGPLEITKSLTLTGQPIKGMEGTPRINAASEGNVLHISGSAVHVQINSLSLLYGRDGYGPVEFGGGIWNEDAHVTLNNVHIAFGKAEFGGGIFNDQGTVEMSNTSLHDNLAILHGGGIYSGGGTLTLDASEISNNLALRRGGGIAINTEYPCRPLPCVPNPGAASVTLNDTLIEDNTAHDFGGGIFAGQGTTVTLSGTSELATNHSWDGGGGVIFWGVSFTLADDATIHGNIAGMPGGGIWTGSLSLLHNCVAGTEGDEGVNVYSNTPDNISTY